MHEKEAISTASKAAMIERIDTNSTTDHVDPSAVGGDYHDLPNGYYRSPQFLGSFMGVILMALSLYLGFVLPANTLQIINQDIGPSNNYVLVATITIVTTGCLLTIVGRLGDTLGRRYFLIAGQAFGFVGGIIGSNAKNISTLIGASVFIGIAGGVQLTFTFVICELVPNKHRGYINAILFGSTIPFSATGPAIARLFVQNTTKGWRWFYYLNMITCGSSFLLFVFFYFPPNFRQLHTRITKREQLKKLDYVGVVSFSAGIVLFMLGVSWGGSSYPWISGQVLGFIFGGVALLIIFVVYEIWMPLEQPLLPIKLLQNRNYIAILCTACVGTMIYFSMNVLWPVQIATLGYANSNIGIGWLSCMTGTGVVVGQVLAGILFKRVGHAKWQLFACSTGMTVFLGGLAAADQYHKSLALAFTLLGGLSVGFLELITTVMAGLVCEPGDIGFASGFLASLRQFFGAIATTVYVTVLENRLKIHLPNDVIPAVTKAGLPAKSLPALFLAITEGTASALAGVPGITPAVELAVSGAVQDAYASSFKTVYLVSITFGGLAMCAALLSKNIDELMTNDVARVMRGVEAKGGMMENEVAEA